MHTLESFMNAKRLKSYLRKRIYFGIQLLDTFFEHAEYQNMFITNDITRVQIK